MYSMIQVFESGIYSISSVKVESKSYFRAKEIATILGYQNTKKAIQEHVCAKYITSFRDLIASMGPTAGPINKLDGSDLNAIYLSEPGMYEVIFSSRQPQAVEFRKWVFESVLPAIRATGSYQLPKTINSQIILKNETDLHYKVVEFIRTNYPDIMLLPGLGEYQKTSDLRKDAWSKGYIGGQPDVVILNSHKTFNGFALELKTPNGNGVLSDKQSAYLTKLKQQNYKTLVSDNYDKILIELIDYFNNTRIHCQYCNKKFKNNTTLQTHYRVIHRISSAE